MPTHQFKCEKCETVVEVLRKIGHHDEPPQKDERKDCSCETPLWTKYIGQAPTTTFAFGWAGGGGGKGSWGKV